MHKTVPEGIRLSMRSGAGCGYGHRCSLEHGAGKEQAGLTAEGPAGPREVTSLCQGRVSQSQDNNVWGRLMPAMTVAFPRDACLHLTFQKH